MPIMHSLTELIQASPTLLAISNALLPLQWYAWLVIFKSEKCPACFSLQHQSQLLFLITLLKYEGSCQTHPRLPAGPPVQEGAECLLSCLGLWGHSGQWVFAKGRQKRSENCLVIPVSQLTSQANCTEYNNRVVIPLTACVTVTLAG